MILGSALFVWCNGLTAWIAARLTRRLLPGEDLATRFLAGLVLFVGLTLLCLQALGSCGLLSAIPVAVLVGLLALATLSLGSSERAAVPTAPTWPRDRLSRAALVAAAGVVLWSVASVLASGPWHGWDSLLYHAPSPAWWMQHRAIEPPPFNSQSYYPLNAELHALWFQLPFRLEAHANLASLAWAGFAIAAFAAHARALGQRPWLAALALCLGLLSPQVHERLRYYTSADLGLATSLLAMLALTWVPASRDRALARALLCGLAAGIALGMKPTAAPIVALAGLAWLWRSRRFAAGLRHVAAFLAGAALLGAPWYVRNLLLTGNPLFPASVGPFEGPLDQEALRATSLMTTLQESWRDPGTWAEVLGSLFDWPYALGFLAAAGYAVGIGGVLRSRDRERRRHLALLLVAGLLFLALFPLAPFSATVNRPGLLSGLQPRYLTFWFLTGLVLLPCVVRLAPVTEAVSARVSEPRRGLPRFLGPTALLVLLVSLALGTPLRQRDATRSLGTLYQSRFRGGWEALEQLPDGARIAVYSRDPPSHALVYPSFGRRLQHTPVAINVDGTARRPLHETWREHADDWWWEFKALRKRPPADGFLRELRRAGVEYLLISEWRPTRPGPTADENHPRLAFPRLLRKERRLFADEHSVLWDVRPEPEERQESSSR